jgi:hypothetical protein
MLSLYSLGAFVEQAWGRWRFLVIYFVAGWGGSCLALAFQPSGVGLIGASGAICGLLGAVGVWFLLYGRYLPPGAGRRGMGQVLFSILFIVVLSVAIEQGVKNVRISHMAHLGGGIAGVIAALILHLQRFGVPALHLRNTTFRWGVAGLLLLLVPMASYLQMQTAWARRAVVRDEDRKDRDKGKKEEVKKEEVKKKKDKGKEEPPAGVAGPFLRHYAEPVSETADALLKTAEDVPVNLEKAKADANTRKTLREQFATHKKTLTQLQDELEKKQYDDERIEEGRKEAVKLLRQGLELCDVAVAYLREPTAQGRESFKNGFEQVDDLAHEFKQRRKKLREL